jgi:hypothetical protein
MATRSTTDIAKFLASVNLSKVPENQVKQLIDTVYTIKGTRQTGPVKGDPHHNSMPHSMGVRLGVLGVTLVHACAALGIPIPTVTSAYRSTHYDQLHFGQFGSGAHDVAGALDCVWPSNSRANAAKVAQLCSPQKWLQIINHSGPTPPAHLHLGFNPSITDDDIMRAVNMLSHTIPPSVTFLMLLYALQVYKTRITGSTQQPSAVPQIIVQSRPKTTSQTTPAGAKAVDIDKIYKRKRIGKLY